MRRLPFRVMQPWGPHKGRQASLISEHPTALEAFDAIDQLSGEMVRTGAPSDAIEPKQELSASIWGVSSLGGARTQTRNPIGERPPGCGMLESTHLKKIPWAPVALKKGGAVQNQGNVSDRKHYAGRDGLPDGLIVHRLLAARSRHSTIPQSCPPAMISAGGEESCLRVRGRPVP